MYGYYSIEPEYFRMSDVARKLNIKGYGTNNLFRFLREKEILEINNQPKDEFVGLGYFKSVTNIAPIHRNCVFGVGSCRVSEKGIQFINALIDESR